MATSTIKRTANVNDVKHEYINTDLLTTPLDTEAVCSFERTGKNVLITFRGSGRSHAENEVFLQIPEGYRSDTTKYYAGVIGSTGTIIQMQTNGNVIIWSPNPASGRLVVQLPYMID